MLQRQYRRCGLGRRIRIQYRFSGPSASRKRFWSQRSHKVVGDRVILDRFWSGSFVRGAGI